MTRNPRRNNFYSSLNKTFLPPFQTRAEGGKKGPLEVLYRCLETHCLSQRRERHRKGSPFVFASIGVAPILAQTWSTPRAWGTSNGANMEMTRLGVISSSSSSNNNNDDEEDNNNNSRASSNSGTRRGRKSGVSLLHAWGMLDNEEAEMYLAKYVLNCSSYSLPFIYA